MHPLTESLVAFFLGSHGDVELFHQLLNQILTTAPPTWCAKDVGGKRHLWDHKNPYHGWRGAGS